MDTVKQPTTDAAVNRTLPLGAARVRRGLHGDDRQPAIRLDALRQPDRRKYHWGRAAIQVAFTIFVVTETWLVPIEGWFVDKYGPRSWSWSAACCAAIAWVMNSYADSLFMLYLAAAIGGIGAGAVYGTCVGNALKWFPDRRGLAAGITAAGFGAGSALTVVPIAAMIKSSGYEPAFLWFGLGQGLIVSSSLFLVLRRAPGERAGASPRSAEPARLHARPRWCARPSSG